MSEAVMSASDDECAVIEPPEGCHKSQADKEKDVKKKDVKKATLKLLSPRCVVHVVVLY